MPVRASPGTDMYKTIDSITLSDKVGGLRGLMSEQLDFQGQMSNLNKWIFCSYLLWFFLIGNFVKKKIDFLFQYVLKLGNIEPNLDLVDFISFLTLMA